MTGVRLPLPAQKTRLDADLKQLGVAQKLKKPNLIFQK
jgi:hypothetical protein